MHAQVFHAQFHHDCRPRLSIRHLLERIASMSAQNDGYICALRRLSNKRMRLGKGAALAGTDNLIFHTQFKKGRGSKWVRYPPNMALPWYE